jgi:hypothetical protein
MRLANALTLALIKEGVGHDLAAQLSDSIVSVLKGEKDRGAFGLLSEHRETIYEHGDAIAVWLALLQPEESDAEIKALLERSHSRPRPSERYGAYCCPFCTDELRGVDEEHVHDEWCGERVWTDELVGLMDEDDDWHPSCPCFCLVGGQGRSPVREGERRPGGESPTLTLPPLRAQAGELPAIRRRRTDGLALGLGSLRGEESGCPGSPLGPPPRTTGRYSPDGPCARPSSWRAKLGIRSVQIPPR